MNLMGLPFQLPERPKTARSLVRLVIELTGQTSQAGVAQMARVFENKRVGAARGKKRPTKNIGAEWQVQTAKARFSEVFRRARTEGPQLITRQGKEGVVMISDEQYDEFVGRSHQPKNLVQFFRESPFVGVELDLERQKDEGREVEL
jgi:prevent-host-death family protein